MGTRVVNFGTHGGLPADFLFQELESVVQPGDTVIYAPEYVYFVQSPRTVNAETLSYLLANAQFYLDTLPFSEYLHVLLTVPAEDLFASFVLNGDQLDEEVRVVEKEHEEIISPLGDQLRNRKSDMGKREKRLHGAIHLDHMANFRPAESFPQPAGREYFKSLLEFRDRLVARDVRLVFTWANAVDFPEYHLPGPSGYFGDLREWLDGNGIPVVGDPYAAMMPKEDFFDSSYHPNSEGTAKRTTRLSEDLKSALTF